MDDVLAFALILLVSFLITASGYACFYSYRLLRQYRIRLLVVELRNPPVLMQPPILSYANPRIVPQGYRVRTGTQVLGSTTTFYPKPQTYTITDADAWLLWSQGVVNDCASRAAFCAKTGMSQQRWANARKVLIRQHLIDRENKAVVERRQVIRAELVG